MIPTDMNENAIFSIDNFDISCIIEHYNYNSAKHAYLVRIKCLMNRNEIKDFVFEENIKKKINPFEMLDL
jgi:hypothetical protein